MPLEKIDLEICGVFFFFSEGGGLWSWDLGRGSVGFFKGR